jgi:hypothetical protein
VSLKKYAPTWKVDLPDGRWVYVGQANTASEAKALAKKEFKLRGRLPQGSLVERMD